MRPSKALTLLLAIGVGIAGLFTSILLAPSPVIAAVEPNQTTSPLLAPAPNQPLGKYQYFGQQLEPEAARQLVIEAGLDPDDPEAYLRVGAIELTPQLLADGRAIFFDRGIGDMFGVQRVFGFQRGVLRLLPEFILAVLRQGFRPTSNLTIYPLRTIELGDQTLRPGIPVDTGLDLKRHGFRFRTLSDLIQNFLPVGLRLSGDITCAICHASVDSRGRVMDGVPNGDLNVPLFIALAPNSAAGFARLNFDPLDPQYQGSGKTIIDANGNLVELPDPKLLEEAFDSAVLDVPQGNFESSPDRINNTTQIPTVFTFRTHPFGFDGTFAVGPFLGLGAITNAVHSSEVNLLAAAQNSDQIIDLDSEVYLGTVLQNAVDKSIRLPAGEPVQPSVWLRQVAPDLGAAELEDQIPAPGTGTYPFLHPSLYTLNGLIFTPDSGNRSDIASGPFLFANNAMAAWQDSIVPPANRTEENRQALASGSVARGAKIFEQANCVSCHIPPYFVDNQVHPLSEIETNPARGISRVGLNDLLVTPLLYTFDTPVPPPAGAATFQVPTEGLTPSPTDFPAGFLPEGGYKTLPLRTLFLSAPYLHDGGVAVGQEALQFKEDGSFVVVNAAGLGLPGTLSQGKLPDPASSLRALVDRDLRSAVIAANQSSPGLVNSNLDGTGHAFYVDAAAGYSPQDQADLVNFLLALDDHPGKF